MSNKVMCDACMSEFKARVCELHYIPEGKIIIEGFICPHCNKEFITTVTDNELREGIYEARNLQDKIAEVNRRKKREYSSYMEDIGSVPTRLCAKYAEELNKLQHKYKLVCNRNKELSEIFKSKYCK